MAVFGASFLATVSALLDSSMGGFAAALDLAALVPQLAVGWRLPRSGLSARRIRSAAGCRAQRSCPGAERPPRSAAPRPPPGGRGPGRLRGGARPWYAREDDVRYAILTHGGVSAPQDG